MTRDTTKDNGAGQRRRRPPAIRVEAMPTPTDPASGADRDAATGYASPARDVLDSIGTPPRAVQRVFSSIKPGGSAPKAYASGMEDRVVRSVEDIGRQVRDARNAMGMTQQRFADLAGVGRRFLIDLEHGKPGLKIGLVLDVCKAAGIRLAVLP
jgi:y4mF family transcriptional regulator